MHCHCMSNRYETEITDSSSIPRNGESKTVNSKNKERKNRAHKATKFNVRSDRTKLTTNSDVAVSINKNTSINVEACDIEQNQKDNKPPLKNNAEFFIAMNKSQGKKSMFSHSHVRHETFFIMLKYSRNFIPNFPPSFTCQHALVMAI